MRKQMKKVVVWLLMLLMVVGILPLGVKTVKAANYSYDKGSVTINSDGSVTVDFTLTEVDATQVLYGFGLCLFEEEPEVLENDKLVNSGNTFYDSDVCKHVYHQELDTPVPEGIYNDTYRITYPADSIDIIGFEDNGNPVSRTDGISLIEALNSGKNWCVVVGVRTSFGGEPHTNCDLYLGKITDISGGTYFVSHEHNWIYEAEGNKIYAWCDSDTLSCEYYATKKEDANLVDTLTATDMVYTGEAYDGASVTNNIVPVTGATVSEMTYFKAENEGDTSNGEAMTTAPTDAGNYYVTVTIKDDAGIEYTAVTSFIISPVDISIGTVNTPISDPDTPPSTIKIVIDGKETELTVGTDCDVAKDDTDPSKIKIVGKGNYTGTVTVSKKVEETTVNNKETETTTAATNSGNTVKEEKTTVAEVNTTAAESVTSDDSASDLEEDDAEDEDASDENDVEERVTKENDETTESSSPVTGYHGIVRMMFLLLILGLVGMVVSGSKIKLLTK